MSDHILDPLIGGLSDPDLLFVCLYGEVRGEPQIGQIAVGSVIRNRTHWHPHLTFRDIISQYAQFSCLWPNLGGKNYEAVKSAARDIVELRRLLKSLSLISDAIYTDAISDPTDGADHYFSRFITPPSWAKSMTFKGRFGNHLFYQS